MNSELAAVLSGALLGISMPGYSLGFIAWIAGIPLVRGILKASPLRAGLDAVLFFATALVVSHWWVLGAMLRNFPEFAGFPPSWGWWVFVLFVLYEAIQYFPLGFFAALFKRKNPVLIIPALYGLVEIVREMGDLGFSGCRISDALFEFPGSSVVISVIGDIGLSMMVVTIWVMISMKPKKGFIVLAFVISMMAALSSIVPTPERNGFDAILVQTAEHPEIKYSQDIQERMEKIPSARELKVLPEAYLTSFTRPSVFRGHGDILVGALRRDGTKVYNSAFLVTNRGVEFYDKVKLFPFVEFLPYPKLFSFLSFLKGFQYFEAGDGWEPMVYRGDKIGVLICFESYFREGAMEYSEKGTDVLFILTNDGWFPGRIALWQHFAKAVTLAAQSGMWIAQVANKGITGVIDPSGRIAAILPIGEEASMKIRFGKSRATVYRYIWRFFPLLPAAMLLIGLAGTPSRAMWRR